VQKPDAQSLVFVQAVPFMVLHPPLPSHDWPFEQLPAISVPAAAATQVPSWPLTAHDWHTPVQLATPQQTPSTQLPDAHRDADADEHPSPLPRLVTEYSQVSSVLKPLVLPPYMTTTPRPLSNVTAALKRDEGTVARLRTYQVTPLASSSHASPLAVDAIGLTASV
jgi:hypothetical protein